MAENDFKLDLIARLKKTESQKQVKRDIQSYLSNIKIPLIGTLNSRTKAQLKKEISSLNNTEKLKPIEVTFDVKKEKLLNDIKLLAQQNSKLFKSSDLAEKYHSLLDNAELAGTADELGILRTQLSSLRSELQLTGNSGITMTKALKNGLSKILQLFENHGIIAQFMTQLRNAWAEAKTLDNSLGDLQKVTDTISDRDALYKYFDRAMNKAQNLNVKINSLIYAITEFKKLGWSLSDAELGGEWATILQNVGEVDIDTAIGSIKTAIASFDKIGGYTDAQMDKKLEAYTDLINNMSNKYSIDAQSLSEAIRLSAGTLTEAHTSIEQAAAMFSSANKYYNDASYLGNLVKISSLRVRASEGDGDAIAELEDMGEEIDDLAEATSSMRDELLGLTGVDIMVDEHTFKSYYDQLYEISQVIDDLSDTSRTNVIETLFGKNRSKAGTALLSGMKESAETYKDAIHSSGSATKEYEMWLQSADAASQRFTNNLTKTYQSIINGNAVRDFTNLGSAVLEFANSWGIVEGTLKSGLIIGAMKGITTLTVALKNSAIQVSNYGVALKAVNNLGNFVEGTDEINKLKTSCSVLTDTQLKQVLAHKNLSDAQLIEILQLDKLDDAQQQARLTQLGLTKAIDAQTAASTANLSITNMLRVAWMKFTTLAKANPMAIGITSIVAATYTAMKISEAWTNRLKDQAQESSNAYKSTLEEIVSINSELQANGQRIDELNAKENLTLIEAEELEKLKESNRELENTLALKEKIAQQEKVTANKDAIKYFEEDTNIYNKETGTFDSTHIEVATQYLDEIYKKEQRIHEIELEMSRTDDKTAKYRELSDELDITQRSYNDLHQRVQDYYDTFTDLDDDLFEGQDDELIQQLEAFYKYMNEVLYGTAETNTYTIRDILAKADFQSASKQLEELGKSEELSVATLLSRFPELITYLEKAGVSAQELYQYIMALSNPDALNYSETEQQFRESLRIRDGEINGASDQKIWNTVKDSFSEDEWQIALEAYLKVRDQYGEHPEGWTAKDWISNIQSELEAEIDEIDAQLSISQTVDQLNTRLKPAFDSLQSAYQNIFTDNGEFALNSIDILSICDSIKSKLDEMSAFGLNVDYSAFEEFVRVLNNTELTEKNVEDAFDVLATSITQAGLSGTEDFETMKTALEDLGVVNETIIAFQALAQNTDALKESGLDLANATYAQLRAFAQEKLGVEDAAQGVAILVYQQMLIANNPLDAMASIQALANLGGKSAETAGMLAELAQIMAQISNLQSWMANNSGADASLVEATLRGLEKKAKKLESQIYTGVDFENIGGGTSKAGKAGGQAADAYLEAFQKEYDHLKDLSDRGEISESQHLTALRALYTRYFKDRKEYLDEYKKYESEYLSGMFDLHNKALSGISTLLNQKINAANDAKDSAISALEEEKEAAAEAYQTQIDALEEEKNAIDDLIKEKEKKIDALNEEADAIQKAADTRKKNIDLQKAEYQLERMLNQRTTAVYRENEGFVFEADTSGIRDAREDVRNAEEGLEINRLQNKADLIRKEINLLEEKKDALTEEQEAIQKMLDESNKYYDNMIKQQEKMWDSMIRNMEQQKSRWEELADIEQIADAYSKVQQVFGEMGYTVEEVLNGNGQAFEDFKSRYISILSDINQNAPFLDGLAYASGVAREQFGSIVSDAQNTVQQLSQTFSDGTFSDAISKGVSDGIVSAQQELNNMNQLGNDAGEGFIEGWKEKSTEISDVTKQTAAEAVEAFAEGQDSNSPSEKYKVLAGDAIDGLLLGMEEKKQLFIDSIRSMSEEGVLAFENGFAFDDSTIKTSFDSLILLIQSVSEALGFGTEDSVGGLLGALNQLSAFSFEENAEGVIAQFEGLRAAIDGVVSAISGGGGESAEGKSLYGKSVSISKRKQTGGNGSEGGGNSITGAFTAMGETAREVIGEPNAEGDGTVIGEFGALETAVTDVADAIGSDQESDPKLSKSNEDSVSLTDSIISLGETTEETLGKSGGDGVIGRFEKFKNVIGEANEHVTGIYTGLKDIDGQTAECTIKVTIETTGDGLWNAAGASMNLGSAQYNAQYLGTACVEGTALASGNWAVQSDEKRALLGELGYEIIVRNGRFFTVGNSGPEMFHIKRGDIVFNHKQSVELLKNGHTSGRGKAYADGTVGGGKILTKEGHILSPVPDDHPMMQMRKKFDAFLQKMGGMEVLSVNAMAEHNRKMGEIMKQINISNIVNHNRNIHPVIHQNITLNCPNVTNDSGVEYIQRQLAHLSQRAYQEPLMNY